MSVDSSSKLVEPHLCHGSQWGIIDPVDTPDGGNVGFHKHMTMMCSISRQIEDESILKWISRNMNNVDLKLDDTTIVLETIELEQADEDEILKYTKVFVNGKMSFVTNHPFQFQELFLKARRSNMIPKHISISFTVKDNYIFIQSDEGRMMRPLLYFQKMNGMNNLNYFFKKDVYETIKSDRFTWNQCIYGFDSLASSPLNQYINVTDSSEQTKGSFYDMNEKVGNAKQSIIDYVDKNEEDCAYICMFANKLNPKLNYEYSHCEIHPSMMFGVMGSQVIFPEHNQLPRNLFACGQAKQVPRYITPTFRIVLTKWALF